MHNSTPSHCTSRPTERDGSHRASGFFPDDRHCSAPTAALVTDQTTDHVQAGDPYFQGKVLPDPSRTASRPSGCQNTSIHWPLHCFTDHLCPPSSPLGRSTTLHLKFGTVSGHPQDRRTLSVVLGDA